MEPKPSSSLSWIRVTVLVAFVAFSCWVGATDPWGWLPVIRARWGAQITLDLCIALSLLWAMIRRDPRYREERVWPWVLATLPLGSIAALAFLVLQRLRARERAVPSSPPQPIGS